MTPTKRRQYWIFNWTQWMNSEGTHSQTQPDSKNWIHIHPGVINIHVTENYVLPKEMVRDIQLKWPANLSQYDQTMVKHDQTFKSAWFNWTCAGNSQVGLPGLWNHGLLQYSWMMAFCWAYICFFSSWGRDDSLNMINSLIFIIIHYHSSSGWWFQSLWKNISQLGWIFLIIIWENKKCSQPPTSH